MRIVFTTATALLTLFAACASPPTASPVAVVAITSAAPRAPRSAAPSVVPAHALAERGPLDPLIAAIYAYFDGGDLGPLNALWSDDLRVRSGRARKPSPRDNVFGKARLSAIYGWAAAHEAHITPTIVKLHSEVTETRALISWSLVMTTPEHDPGAFAEEYEFTRQGAAWKMVRFDDWPLLPDTLEEFSSSFWADADAKVDDARASGDDRTLAYDLLLAHRFDECAEVARRLTDASPGDAWAWGVRATATSLVGDRADAERSLEAQRKLQSKRPSRRANAPGP